jgi:hypothetical protein
MIELSALAHDQELGRGVVEPLALQLPDGRAQLENLGSRSGTHPVADIRQNIAATCSLPFADQKIDFLAQIHLRQGLLGAVAIAVDEFSHRRLDVGHFQPQGADFTSNFINSVVHGLLEQNKNI